MAGTALNVQAWSPTAASNSGADSTIGTLADGSFPSSVDDWVRGLMASVKKHSLDIGGGLTAGGTADALTLTTNQSIVTGHQAAGFSLRFKAANTNTTAATVAVDGLSAVSIKRMNGDALSAGDIVTGGVYDIAFTGTNYILMGANVSTGLFGTLAGSNTWSGANIFSSSVTVGDGAGDAVVIKGTTVDSYMSGLLSTSSVSALRSAIGLPLGTSGANVPLLNTQNTWGNGSNAQVFSRNGDIPASFVRVDSAASNVQIMTFYGSTSTTAGSILIREGSTPSFSSTSDRNLKDEIAYLSGAERRIMGIRPVEYNWKKTGRPGRGFIAQEFADLYPEDVIHGNDLPIDDPDFKPWEMGYGHLIPDIVATLQSIMWRLNVAA